jgi:Arc/MetJ-type ribon-helix-helix transcriptional regulator
MDDPTTLSRPEKKLAEITVRVPAEMKSMLVGLAEKRGLDGGASDLVRLAIAELLERERAEYEALHSIFGPKLDG